MWLFMKKTKEELNQLKSEYETLNTKLKELSDEELKEVVGGSWLDALNKIGKAMQQNAKQVLKSSNTVSPEETLGGKIPVYPNGK